MERREDQGQKWEAFGPRGGYKGSVMGEKGVTALRALGERGDAGSQRLVKARVAPGAGREGRDGPGGFGHPTKGAAVVKLGMGRERGGC